MSSVEALLGMLVVLVVPGILVAGLARWPLGSVTTWAGVPVLSVGLIFLLAELMTPIGSLFDVGAFVGLVVLLGTALVVRAWRDRVARLRVTSVAFTAESSGQPCISIGAGPSARVAFAPERRAPACEKRLSQGFLVISILLGLFIWAHGMHGAVVPPKIDSANHGFFVARIVHTGSIDSSKVVVTDPDGASKVADFYPLGMHAAAAIATELARAPVGRVLIDFAVTFAAVVFPLGMFALARFLAPQRVLVAGLTALLAPMLSLYTYPALQIGLLALLVGMAMVPVSVVVVTQSLRVGSAANVWSWLRALVPSALVVVAVTAVHPSEIATLTLLVTLLLVGHTWRSWRAVINVLGRAFALLLIIVVMLSPTISGLVSGSSERSSYDPFANSKRLSVGRAITQTVELTNASETSADRDRARHHLPPVRHAQVLYAILAAVGAAILLWRRRPAFVVAWGIVIALTVIAYSSNGTLSKALTSSWYRQGYRLAMNQAFFVPFFAAIALEVVLMGLAQRLRTRTSLVAAATTISAVAVVAVGIQGYREATATIEYSFGTSQMKMMPAAENAFNWLHTHERPSDTVINDIVDGSSWMYAEANVRPLFAARAGDGNIALALALLTPDVKARNDLFAHADLLGSNPRIDALARHYHARWIYYGTATIFPFAHMLRLTALRQNPHLHEVFRRDGVHVFQIDIPMPSE
jgi:hypothetical protein